MNRDPSVAEIQAKVCALLDVPLIEMRSARRWAEFVRARHVAMYLARNLTPQSLPQIGRSFGDRNHTTVMHAVRRIEDLRERDLVLDAQLTALTAEITLVAA